MGTLAYNIRVGVRTLRKHPTFTAAAVLTLALGIGATTAMFSVIYGVLLRPLPFGEPDRLVRVWTAFKPHMGRGAVSAANGRDWRAQNHVFQDLALIHTSTSFNFMGAREPERLRGARVSASLFPILQVSPLLGRTFAEQENEIGRENVVVLSHPLWVRAFGADPAIVGRTIPLNGVPTTVVGVMKPDFQYPSREFELWMPLTVPPAEYNERSSGSYSAVARLKPGVTLEEARADMSVVASHIARQYPAYENMAVGLAPLLDDIVGAMRRPLFILLGAVAAMLLIGCANLTNLLLARGITRRRELALRTALGASRARLLEQSVAELLPLLALGALLGLVMASAMLRALVPLLPADLPRADGIAINLPVLGFTTLVTILVALLVGIWPALDSAKTSVSVGLADLSRSSTSAPRRARVRDALVVGQIATTVLLLVGAAVLVRSFVAMRQVSPGFDPQNVLTAHFAIPRAKYPLDRDVAAFYTRVLDRIPALPGVVSVGMISRLPLGGSNQTGGVQIDGFGDDAPWPNVQTRTASPDYFRALQTPIKEGRSFTASDGFEAPRVAIIDERLANTLWPGESAIGHRLREGQGMPWSTIVGVVGRIRHTGLDDDAQGQVYWNYPQRFSGTDRMALVIRTRNDPAALTRSVADAIRAIDPEQPIYDARAFDQVVDRSLGNRRFQMTLLALFAAIALLLASIGTYGVIAYGVGQRLREFGVRMALGAQRRDVIAMVLRRGGALFALGAIVGLALAAATVQVLSTLVYAVAPHDPWSFITSALVLFVASMAACFLPARRAALVEPSIALRSE